jgi:hypothetical protein
VAGAHAVDAAIGGELAVGRAAEVHEVEVEGVGAAQRPQAHLGLGQGRPKAEGLIEGQHGLGPLGHLLGEVRRAAAIVIVEEGDVGALDREVHAHAPTGAIHRGEDVGGVEVEEPASLVGARGLGEGDEEEDHRTTAQRRV